MQRFDAVFFMLARLVTVFSLAFLVPLVWTWADDDLKEIEIWLGSFLATLCCGLLLWALTRRARRELDVRDGFLLVNLVWLVLPAFEQGPWEDALVALLRGADRRIAMGAAAHPWAQRFSIRESFEHFWKTHEQALLTR